MSQNQLLYERKLHQKKRIIQWIRIALFLCFFIIWEITARKNVINIFFYSSPSRLIQCFIESISRNQLISHIGISLYETLISFLLIMLLSILAATLLWRFQSVANIFEPVFVILNSLPKSALAPLIIVWLGTGSRTIIITGISVAIFGCILNLYSSFLNTDIEKQTLIKTMGGSRLATFFYVILPANKDALFSNMKVNIGLSLVGVMIGEFLAARKGLGYLIIYSSQVFQMDMLILCILILCIIAIFLYQLLNYLEKRILH